MADSFALALDEWTAYYALMGGAAATLLGLLFVAVSFRLNIFREQAVADVRAFAGFACGAFLMGIAVPGLALAPHEHPGTLATTLSVAALAGLLGSIRIDRLWTMLNPAANPAAAARTAWQGRLYGLVMAAPYVGLAVVAALLWRAQPSALGWLAIVEGLLLALGTAAAWLLLSNAGASDQTRGEDHAPL